MSAGQIAQTAFILVHLGILVVTTPSLYRLITGYRPIRNFDPVKALMALVTVCYINNLYVRSADGAVLPNKFEWILASGLSTISFLSVVVAVFLTERALFRAREP